MKINLTGRNIKITDALRNTMEEKLERLKRHFDRILSIDVIFEVEKLKQVVKATIFASGTTFHAEDSSEDMYSAIDGLVDKLDRQIKDHKEKHHAHASREHKDRHFEVIENLDDTDIIENLKEKHSDHG